VDPEVLHELFVFDLLPPLVITLNLVFYLFDSVRIVAVTRHLISSEIASVEQSLLEYA